MGDAVLIACFFAFLFFGYFTFAPSPGTVASAMAAVMVMAIPRESVVEATVVEKAVAMPLLFKRVSWVVADRSTPPAT